MRKLRTGIALVVLLAFHVSAHADSLDDFFAELDYEEWLEELEEGIAVPHVVPSEVEPSLDPPIGTDPNNVIDPQPWWRGLDPTEIHEILNEEHDLFGDPLYGMP